jgi:hypothetical protein
MPESAQNINVAAEERTHPAVRKLARALIQLARLRTGESAPAPAGDTPAAGSEAGRG